MSKPRVTTDEQDREIAAWFDQMRSFGTVHEKAKSLGISVSALYDAAARGRNQPTAAERFKLRYLDDVSRESKQSESIDES
jgi:hypothetical protein